MATNIPFAPSLGSLRGISPIYVEPPAPRKFRTVDYGRDGTHELIYEDDPRYAQAAPASQGPGYIGTTRGGNDVYDYQQQEQARNAANSDFMDRVYAGLTGMFGGGGSQPASQPRVAQGVTPQDRVNARAAALADARLRDRIGTGPRNPWDSFGLGGGDWAGAWQDATRPQTDLRSLLGAQLLAGPNTSSGLAGLFNSASGPYGQMQMAAAYTAPARQDAAARRYEADTQRDIAGLKYGTANKIASQLANLIGGQQPLTGLQTDYGASAHLRPTDLRRFFTRK